MCIRDRNPNTLRDMEKTTLRLLKAINENERIGIFGDYDVDGASSTAIIGNYLKMIKQDFFQDNPLTT